MLSELHLVDTGPGPKLDLELGPRLNVLTGDNGLGKSFVLDVIWWVLTGVWVGTRREKHLQLHQSGHMSLPMLDEWDPLLARALRGSGEGGEARAG